MHLEHGAVTPGCAAVTFGISGLMVGYACHVLRREPGPMRNLGLAAALGSAVFVAQMINFPISGVSSAHLVGGALLAWVLRPALGLVVMTMVLTVQALFMGDGGLMSLGANVLNMAVVPALAVVAVRAMMGRGQGQAQNEPQVQTSRVADFAGLALASFIATVVGAGALVGQVGLFRGDFAGADYAQFSKLMLLSHAYIGVIEAGLACCVLAVIRLAAGMQTGDASSAIDAGRGRLAMGTLAVLLLAVVPFGSELHDGYEAAAHATGLDALIAQSAAKAQGIASAQQSIVGLMPTGTLVNAGLVTLLFVAGLLAVLAGLSRLGKQTAQARVAEHVTVKADRERR